MNTRNHKDTLRGEARPGMLGVSVLLVGIVLLSLLAACSPAGSAGLTQTAASAGTPLPTQPPVLVPTDVPAVAPVTITPSPSATATLPISPAVIQGLKDAFNCLTNNLNYAPSMRLDHFCPAYWGDTSANLQNMDGTLLRKSLEPNLSPLRNLRWRLTGITDVKKDEVHSTKVNPIYTANLSTILSGDVTLVCPSGTPAPFETTVNIPVSGQARISISNYLNEPVESVQIESWAVQGNPLEDYCATLH